MEAEHAVLLARGILGLTFLASATGKLRDLTAFTAAVEDFDLIPRRWARAAAFAVVTAELALVATMGVGGPLLMPGFAVAAVVLVLFTGVLASTLRRRRVVSCNCFGAATAKVSGYDIVRNAGLIAVAVAGALSAQSAEEKGISASEVLVLVLMAAGFTLVALNLADVARTLRQPFRIPDHT